MSFSSGADCSGEEGAKERKREGFAKCSRFVFVVRGMSCRTWLVTTRLPIAVAAGTQHSALSICKAASSHIETRGRTRVQCNGTHARKPGTVYRQEIDNAMHPGLQSTIVFRPDL
jgi:hypothetical protein